MHKALNGELHCTAVRLTVSGRLVLGCVDGHVLRICEFANLRAVNRPGPGDVQPIEWVGMSHAGQSPREQQREPPTTPCWARDRFAYQAWPDPEGGRKQGMMCIFAGSWAWVWVWVLISWSGLVAWNLGIVRFEVQGINHQSSLLLLTIPCL